MKTQVQSHAMDSCVRVAFDALAIFGPVRIHSRPRSHMMTGANFLWPSFLLSFRAAGFSFPRSVGRSVGVSDISADRIRIGAEQC